MLLAVSALSSSDAWATGFYVDDQDESQPLLLRWDGSSWTMVPEAPISKDVDFLSVSDAFGLGLDVERWDGTTWTSVSPGPAGGGWRSVDATDSENAWVVGTYISGGFHTTLSSHWDGSSWSVLYPQNPGDRGNTLDDVAAVPGSSTVWAVGSLRKDVIKQGHHRTNTKPLIQKFC